jgi:hypothetical protein
MGLSMVVATITPRQILLRSQQQLADVSPTAIATLESSRLQQGGIAKLEVGGRSPTVAEGVILTSFIPVTWPESSDPRLALLNSLIQRAKASITHRRSN